MKKAMRLISFVMATVILVSVFTVMPSAAEVTHTGGQSTYDIVIAYDDSGSMSGAAIQNAMYAAQIFAAMMDYDNGDKLTIYRMNDDNGNLEKTNKIEITDVKNVTTLGDPSNKNYIGKAPGGTYFYPVNRGYDQLKSSKANNKWIIFMTDGSGIGYDGCNMFKNDKVKDVKEAARIITGDGISFQYLGFGGAVYYGIEDINPKDPPKGTPLAYEKLTADSALLTDLVSVCNTIFDRNEYELNGNELDFGISMEKVVVFAQGTGVSINGLKDEGENYVGIRSDSKVIKHANGGVSGQVVIFDACKAGKYTLECTGASSVQVFYELDVDMEVALAAEGNNSSVKIDSNTKEMPAGTYKVEMKLKDNQTGKFIDMNNENVKKLLGKVEKSIGVKTANDKEFKFTTSETVTLTKDSNTDIMAQCTYLDGKYAITSNDTKTGLPFDLKVIDVPQGDNVLELKLTQSQPDGKYSRDDETSWQPLTAELTFKGKPLTDEEMEYVDLTFDKDNKVGAEVIGKSGNKITFKLVKGSAELPDKETELKVKAEYKVGDFICHDDEESISVSFGTGLGVKIDVLQASSWYTVLESDKWKPIQIDVTYNGEPLTEGQVKDMELNITVDGITWRKEHVGGSTYNVYVGEADDGSFVKPEKGSYKIKVTAKLGDSAAEDEAGFSVRLVPVIVVYLAIIIAIVILLIIWLLIMLTKVLPKKVDKDEGMSQVTTMNGVYGANFVNVEFKRNQKTLRVHSKSLDGMSMAATFKLKPMSNRFTKSKNREYAIVGINSNCDDISINGLMFVKAENGAWVSETALLTLPEGAKLPPINFRGKNMLITLNRQGNSLDTRAINVK